MKTNLKIVKENGINPLSVTYVKSDYDNNITYVLNRHTDKLLGLINLKSKTFSKSN